MTRVAALTVAAVAACTTAGDPPARPASAPVVAAAHAPADAAPPPPDAAVDAPVAAATTAAIDAGATPAPIGYAAAIRAADWARWPGLPADLREATLVRDLRLGRAASDKVQLSRTPAIVVQARGARYWMRDRDRVVLVELTANLGVTAPADLLAQLPSPDREGAGRHLESGATTTEYVFASRGLAITVAASYDRPPRFPPRLAAVQLFAPTDLRTFDLELGGRDRVAPSR
jgi:hypothetical protein